MQLTNLFSQFNKLQILYGEKNLDPVYGCGEINNPDLFLIFMNPTARNVSANKNWKGIKAPWLGTKNIWNMLFQLNLLSQKLIKNVNEKKPLDWDYDFSFRIYENIANNSVYITNLSKATQVDAKPLSNQIFKKYLDLLYSEIEFINPKKIITFGNQVSSIVLDQNICVTKCRRQSFRLKIKSKNYNIFPTYYPVGQGMRNISLVKEDIIWIKNL